MIKSPLLSPAACGPHQPGCYTRRNSAPYELGQCTSFWVAAGVVAHTLWTSAAPAMTYPLFAEEWHLTHTVTTGVFAIYPIVVAAVLVGFGDVSDYVGRRAAILWDVALRSLAPYCSRWRPMCSGCLRGVPSWASASASRHPLDRRDGEIQRPRSGKARRHDHNCCPSRRFCRGPAARRCPHSICSTAHAAELLGAVLGPGRAVCRGMVPAAPYRQRSPWPLASQHPLHTEPLAQRFRGRG